MRKAVCAAMLGAILTMTGCAVMATGPVLAPLAVDLRGPVAVGDTNAAASKVGEAQAQGILVFAFGDASIQAAANQGQITRIHHVDTEVLNVLGLYARYKTIVYGE